MIVDVSGYTNVGLVRSTNQDSILVRAEKNYGMFVVADGMGGHSGGDYASQTIIKELAAWWDGGAYKNISNIEDLANECREQILRVNSTIYNQFKAAGLVGGSTLVIVLVNEDKFATLTIGDSHIYRLCGTNMIPMSVDDVWENLPSIRESMTQEEIMKDSRCGKLTAAIGALENVGIHMDVYDQNESEYIMLCSDGIYKYCGADELSQGFASGAANNSTKTTVEMLSSFVLANGASDNFSVVICKTRKSSGLGYVPSCDFAEVITEPNCDIKIASEIFKNVEIFKANEQVPQETPIVDAPVPEAAPAVATAPVMNGNAVPSTPVVDNKGKEESLNMYSDSNKGINKILIIVVAALVVLALVIGLVIAKKSKKETHKDDSASESAESTVVETGETSIDVVETVIETEPSQQISFDNEALPLTVRGTSEEVINNLNEPVYYFGDFDGDSNMDGFKISFEKQGNDVQPYIIGLDANGNEVGEAKSIADLVNQQYDDGDKVGLLPAASSGRTTLLANVVNDGTKDFLVLFYAPSGLDGNKYVSIISSYGYVPQHVNTYARVGGVANVMNSDGVTADIDAICNYHLGKEFVNVDEEVLNSGVWKFDEHQMLVIVYN